MPQRAGSGWGQDRAVLLERKDPFSPLVWPRSREGIGGGVARGHRMAVPAAGRCLCRGWQGCGVPACGVPVVLVADGVLVGVPALCPGGGPLPEGLRAEAALRAVPGEPCAAPGVCAG